MAPMMRRFAGRPALSSRGGHLVDANGFLFGVGVVPLEILPRKSLRRGHREG